MKDINLNSYFEIEIFHAINLVKMTRVAYYVTQMSTKFREIFHDFLLPCQIPLICIEVNFKS